jgi:hypothetical protein
VVRFIPRTDRESTQLGDFEDDLGDWWAGEIFAEFIGVVLMVRKALVRFVGSD